MLICSSSSRDICFNLSLASFSFSASPRQGSPRQGSPGLVSAGLGSPGQGSARLVSPGQGSPREGADKPGPVVQGLQVSFIWPMSSLERRLCSLYYLIEHGDWLESMMDCSHIWLASGTSFSRLVVSLPFVFSFTLISSLNVTLTTGVFAFSEEAVSFSVLTAVDCKSLRF